MATHAVLTAKKRIGALSAYDRLGDEAPTATRFLLGLIGLLIVTVTMAFATVVFIAAVLFGHQPSVLMSGSMSPALEAGDVVLFEELDPAEVGIGNVILFETPGRPDVLTAHRVTAVDALARLITTQGDANRDVDSSQVPFDSVKGSGRIAVPLIGLPTMWLATGQNVLFGIFVLVMALATWMSRWALLDRFDPWMDTFEAVSLDPVYTQTTFNASSA